MSDDHVIKHLDFENPGSFVEPPSQAEIRFLGLGSPEG
jgi:hypothetical protein